MAAIARDYAHNRRAQHFPGEVIGRFTVVSFAGFIGNQSAWSVRCNECGYERVMRKQTLRGQQNSKCGCHLSRAHAMRSSPGHPRVFGATLGGDKILRSTWRLMIDRCNNPRSPSFCWYGGRGIAVCDRWMTFSCFCADMGPRPSPRHQIDRIDNDGNYEPGNCRWATHREQHRNRTDNRWLEHNGRRMILTDWAQTLNLTKHRLADLLKRHTESDVLSGAVK